MPERGTGRSLSRSQEPSDEWVQSAEEARYGFRWGPLVVTRLFESRGRRMLKVSTDKHVVEVYASPTGRRMRVWLNDKELS